MAVSPLEEHPCCCCDCARAVGDIRCPVGAQLSNWARWTVADSLMTRNSARSLAEAGWQTLTSGGDDDVSAVVAAGDDQPLAVDPLAANAPTSLACLFASALLQPQRHLRRFYAAVELQMLMTPAVVCSSTATHSCVVPS